MTRHVHAVFPDPETPRELISVVLARVALARRRAARLRLAALGCGLCATSLALIPASLYALGEFQASGFYSYASLVFSDSQVALAYWQQLSFSLIESLPSFALLLLASLATTFVWSFRRTVLVARTAFATA